MTQKHMFAICIMLITSCASQNENAFPPTSTFPQMTETAQAIPKVVYPTELPLTVDELIQSNAERSLSPNGEFLVVCGYPFATMISVSSHSRVSVANVPFYCNSEESVWSSDSSYLLFDSLSQPVLYRWQTNGSQPRAIPLNIQFDTSTLSCASKLAWDPQHTYLALLKGCGLYVIQPDDETSYANPLIVEDCDGCLDNFRWATPQVLLVTYYKSVGFVHIPSGKTLGNISVSGGTCAEQIPLLSPDQRWMLFDKPWCGGGERGPNQSVLVDLQDGSQRVFVESIASQLDFIGWAKDSSEFYVINRPIQLDATSASQPPFGLLAISPTSLHTDNLFEQAWFVAFDQRFEWAFVVFPARRDDGTLGLDGGLWKRGATELLGKQTMANRIDEKYLDAVVTFGVASFDVGTNQALASSSTATVRVVPAAWSPNGAKLATINADHQLIIIDQTGNIQLVAQLADNQEWLYSSIQWSGDGKTLVVNETTWTVP